MGSPFYNKDKSKLKKPVKIEQLDKIVINAPKGKAFGSKAMKDHATYESNGYQRPLSKPLDISPSKKDKKPRLTPSRVLNEPSERIMKKSVAKPFNEQLMKKSTVMPMEAYAPAQFEGAKPLVQSSQRKIYSTFKEQMEQLKNK